MIKILLSSVIFASQAFAGLPPTTVKGQSEANKTTTFNIEAPYNQGTTTAAVTRLLETGNENLLLNPNFEATTATTSWTFQSGAVGAAETTEVKSGKKSVLVTLTSVNGLAVSQDVTPTIKLEGSNIESGVWIKTSLTTLQVCTRRAAATYGQCATVLNDNIWHYYQVFQPGPSSGSIGISIVTTGSTSGTFYMDNTYTGLANLGQATPPNTFTAQISAAGAASTLTGDSSWISGCSITDISFYDCTLAGFNSRPNCEVQPQFNSDPSGAAISATIRIDTSSNTSLKFRTTVGTVSTAIPVSVSCTKTGADFVQNAVTAQNYNFGWTTVTSPTCSWTSNTTCTMKVARDGENLLVQFAANTSGVPTSASLSFDLPFGLQADTNKMLLGPNNTWTTGKGTARDVGVNSYDVMAYYVSATQFQIRTLSVGATYGTQETVTQAVPFSFNAGDGVQVTEISIPIVGWTETMNAPQLLGSVTSNYSGAIRDESLSSAGASYGTACSTSPCTIYGFYTSWATVTRASTGVYTLNYPGTFSAPPDCSFDLITMSGPVAITHEQPTSTSQVFRTYNTSFTAADAGVSIKCRGPR